MQFFVRSSSTHVVDVGEESTVGDVREFICDTECLPQAEVSLLNSFMIVIF